MFWPLVAAALLGGGVGAHGARAPVERGATRRAAFYAGLLAAASRWPSLGTAALVAGSVDDRTSIPTGGVYAATVWLLVIWTAVHVAVGVIMQLYCVARRLAGRMTARHDIDIVNVALYWHFTAVTVAITVAVIAGFPAGGVNA